MAYTQITGVPAHAAFPTHTPCRPWCDHDGQFPTVHESTVVSLSILPELGEGDAAAVSELARRRRARATVADADAAYRAELVTAYHESRDEGERLALLAEAAEYGMAHPDEPSLVAEMRPRRRGGAA